MRLCASWGMFTSRRNGSSPSASIHVTGGWVGLPEGANVGIMVGDAVGLELVGLTVGERLGPVVGDSLSVGAVVGRDTVGERVGPSDGEIVGPFDGEALDGESVGEADGDEVGDVEGMAVGVYVSQPAQVNRQLLANARSVSHWFSALPSPPTASRPALHSLLGRMSLT